MQIFIGVIVLLAVLALAKTILDMLMRSSLPAARHDTGAKTSSIKPAPFFTRGKTDSALLAMERRMLDLVNCERARHRLESRFARPLKWDEAVARVARAHSVDMACLDYIGHIDPEGSDPAKRLRLGGAGFTMSGENVARGFMTPEAAMKAFMDEPRFQQNHRANIMSPRFTHIGIGIVRDKGGLSITQNFIRR